ncbi:fibronectin type III domain-containing protein [Bisporella sp. PMI_857]|nr:fibronectin type III domain-containing protein [Bisporella sp. PMI_857]
MIVGDSITHGAEGDFTWRYRLAKWLEAEDVKFEFKGPYIGTHPPAEPHAPQPPRLVNETAPDEGPPKTNGEYAKGISFDSHHYAVWGKQAAQVKSTIKAEVSRAMPNYLLVMLGFNDLGWWVSGPEGTLESIKTIVNESRAAKPDIKILLANVVHRELIPGREDLPVITMQYNKLLADAMPRWETSISPVRLVDVQGKYTCAPSQPPGSCPSGYDGLHPNARGEFEIASAFIETLVKMGVGSRPMSLPPTRGYPVRAMPDASALNLTARSAPSGVIAEWEHIFGAYGYDVRARLRGTAWNQQYSSTTRWYTTWTIEGQVWEYQVRISMGNNRKSAWSSIVSAVAHPQTAPGPSNITSTATNDGFTLAWGEPRGPYMGEIDRYEVIFFDMSVRGSFPGAHGFKGNSATVTGLRAGHRYGIFVATWTEFGGGFPAGTRSIRVGGGSPLAPTNLQVVNTSPASVRLTWKKCEGAAGYLVYIRRIGDGTDFKPDDYADTTETSFEAGYLFPGTWEFEFCVKAYNGNQESGRSDCVVPPKWLGS